MSGLLMTRKTKAGPIGSAWHRCKVFCKKIFFAVAHNGTLRKRAKPNLSSPSGLMPLYGIRPAYAGPALPGFIHKKVHYEVHDRKLPQIFV
jgi:hypothetical protein